MRKKIKVLAVDDEYFICRLIKRIMEQAGYDVVTVANGLEALDELSRNNFDLVLLDIMMPRLDGFQTLDLIRQRYDVVVIMLTGRNEVTVLHDTFALGADDYIVKPFSKLELLARIEAKLRRACSVNTATESANSPGILE